MIRFGIRTVKVKLRPSKHLEELRGLEGEPLPPNTMAQLRRDLLRLQLIRGQIREIERTRLERLKRAPRRGTHPMMRMLARILGIGIETADMLVDEVLSRKLRDQRGVARYGGLTGSPDESGSKRRERGLARAGNARVRRGMIQLAWRWLMFQNRSALAQWYRTRTAGARGSGRKDGMGSARAEQKDKNERKKRCRCSKLVLDIGSPIQGSTMQPISNEELKANARRA